MAAYVPVIIWLVSVIICHYIAKARHVKSTLTRRFIVVFFGPLAIPLVFLVKPENSVDSH